MIQPLHPDYRTDIDGLRAVAVLGVLLYHFFPRLLPGGFVGVDIFFVISGFLISKIIFESLSAGRFRFHDFYVRRINRIFPALLVMLLFTLFVGRLFLLPGEFSLLGKHVTSSAGFVQNFVLLSESGYFDVASEYKPLLHIWSLGIEEQFYFVFPILLVLSWKLSKRFVPWLIILLAVSSFVLNYKGIHSLRRDPTATFFLPHTRFWELFAGSLLAYFVNTKTALKPLLPFSNFFRISAFPLRFNDFISAVGFSIIFSSFFALNSQPFPGVRALLPVAGTVLLILAGPNALFIGFFCRTASWLR